MIYDRSNNESLYGEDYPATGYAIGKINLFPYNDTLALGWDYQSDPDANSLIAKTIGLEAIVTQPNIELDLFLAL